MTGQRTRSILDPEISDRKSVKAATRGLDMAQLVAHPVSSRVNTPRSGELVVNPMPWASGH
ncbi:hypothetical protein CKO14_09465 [Halorhodospira halophila]|nr:hypothetical protein [Halorhodospira halophila]